MVFKYKIAILFVWLAAICQPCRALAESDPLERANDFIFTLATGEQRNLYDLDSERVLLYFYDPTCEDCHKLMGQLNRSEAVNQCTEKGLLTVLAVYPDDDTELWNDFVSHVPEKWINAYDLGAKIHREGIYEITTIPTLYLLDQSKDIRLKNASFDQIENDLKQFQNK